MLDTDLAKALGMPNPAQIRVTIKANWAALEQFGGISSVMKNSGPKGGRPSTAYWLTEEQALYVTMHCRTDRAEAVKVQFVKVFTAYRRGALMPVEAAPVALPYFSDPVTAFSCATARDCTFVQYGAV